MRAATDNGMAYGADRAYDELCVEPEDRENAIDEVQHRLRLECGHVSGAAESLVSDACDDPEAFVARVVRAVARHQSDVGVADYARIGVEVVEKVEQLIRAQAAMEVDRRRPL